MRRVTVAENCSQMFIYTSFFITSKKMKVHNEDERNYSSYFLCCISIEKLKKLNTR